MFAVVQSGNGATGGAGGIQPGDRGSWSLEDVTITEPAVIRRAVGAAAIGNVTEWFDFGVFGYLETTIRQVFFSGLSQAAGSIAVLLLASLAFLLRPIGGLFFGPLGDRIGRTKVLSLTVIMMAVGTFVMALIPSYAAIGAAAPLLVLLARLVQAFSTGGEYGGAMSFIAEYAPDRRRGFLGSFLEFGTVTGYVLGAVIALLVQVSLSHEALLSWGWRIPFLISGPIGAAGLYLRLKLEETPAFAALAAQSESRESHQSLREIRTIFRDHWRPVLVCGGLVLGFNVTNYMLTFYMPTYLSQELPHPGVISENTSQLLQIVVLLFMLSCIAFLGRLSDRVGRKPVVFTGCALMVVLGIPSIALMRIETVPGVLGGLLLMAAMLLGWNSTMPSTLPALFPTEVRYGGLSIAFNLSVSLFGGTTATVVAALIAATGDPYWPGYYLMMAGVIGAVACFFVRESASSPLPGSAPSAADEAEARELLGLSGKD